ncbi:hypothetical protein QTO34_010287 [Cnephaeus nilssonii]|uniref:EF-hand domain-containing protein n=1 Tax=Cnephaeus nilssonii TaxID=3371016 RepID=A0AA40HF71_CNENI|nr:hypothetical protein QTO34_010287 [Eptesicus nilssonii]
MNFNDFLAVITQKMCEKDSKEEILKAFKLFDDDESGTILFNNLKRVTTEMGENITDEELQEMIDEADRDGDGEDLAPGATPCSCRQSTTLATESSDSKQSTEDEEQEKDEPDNKQPGGHLGHEWEQELEC